MSHDLTYSIEAEQSVIGGLLIDTDAFDRIRVPLEDRHFFNDSHRRIWRHIVANISACRPVDVITLAESLERTGEGLHTGGLAYLGELAANVPSAANINRYAEIVVEKAQLRDLIAAGADIQAMAQTANADVAETLDKAQSLVMAVYEGKTNTVPRKFSDVAAKHLELLETRMDKIATAGLATGFIDLDRKLSGGFRAGQLVFIAGRPAMGKTSLGLQIASNVATAGNPALFLSQEMSETDVADRFYAMKSGVSLEKIISGELQDEHFDALALATDDASRNPLYIDEQSSLRFFDVAAKARQVRRHAGGKLALIVIDYLQLMVGEGDNRNAEIEKISRSLKALAKQMNCPVLALSQLNRGLESRTNKRPILSDLRDSGSIEQDADIVLMVYRDEVYNQDSNDAGTAEILVRKNRQGSTGDVRLSWQGECARFGNLDMLTWERDKRELAEQKRLDKPMKRRRGFNDWGEF